MDKDRFRSCSRPFARCILGGVMLRASHLKVVPSKRTLRRHRRRVARGQVTAPIRSLALFGSVTSRERSRGRTGRSERILVRVESVDKVERSTLALKMVQQVQGQKRSEAWHLIVRRYDQRNTSDRKLGECGNNSERYHASDVGQFGDVLGNFIHETNK